MLQDSWTRFFISSSIVSQKILGIYLLFWSQKHFPFYLNISNVKEKLAIQKKMLKKFQSTSIFVVLFFLNTYICRIPRWMGVRLGICVSWTYALDEIYDWMKRRLFIRLDLTVCLQMFSLIRKKINKNSRRCLLF